VRVADGAELVRAIDRDPGEHDHFGGTTA
jgi:hypothetical protein